MSNSITRRAAHHAQGWRSGGEVRGRNQPRCRRCRYYVSASRTCALSGIKTQTTANCTRYAERQS